MFLTAWCQTRSDQSHHTFLVTLMLLLLAMFAFLRCLTYSSFICDMIHWYWKTLQVTTVHWPLQLSGFFVLRNLKPTSWTCSSTCPSKLFLKINKLPIPFRNNMTWLLSSCSHLIKVHCLCSSLSKIPEQGLGFKALWDKELLNIFWKYCFCDDENLDFVNYQTQTEPSYIIRGESHH